MAREGVEEDEEEKENEEEEEEEEEEMREQDRQLREQQRLSVGLAALAHPLSFSVLDVRGLTRNGLRLQLAGLVFTGLISGSGRGYSGTCSGSTVGFLLLFLCLSCL